MNSQINHQLANKLAEFLTRHQIRVKEMKQVGLNIDSVIDHFQEFAKNFIDFNEETICRFCKKNGGNISVLDAMYLKRILEFYKNWAYPAKAK